MYAVMSFLDCFISSPSNLSNEHFFLKILHAKCTDKSESEMTELALKIEANMRRFDKTQKGKLTVDDIYNVVKVGPTNNNT